MLGEGVGGAGDLCDRLTSLRSVSPGRGRPGREDVKIKAQGAWDAGGRVR